MARNRLTAIALFLAIPMVIGCGQGGGLRSRDDWKPEDVGDLPGARRSSDSRLQAELARLDEEQLTPAALSRGDIPPEENAAEALRDLFPKSMLEGLQERSARYVPPPGTPLDATTIEGRDSFLSQYQRQQQQARAALERPAADFGLRPVQGFFSDQSLLETAVICARLEMIDALEHVSADDPAGALPPVGYALKWAQQLAAQKHLRARLEAAFLRSEILSVIHAMVHHPSADAAVHAELYRMLAEQLENWTPDADAWIGDRAIGLHTYEVIRAMRGSLLLGPEDMQILSEEGLLDQIVRPDLRQLDDDQVFYLSAMGEMIDACELPYFQRQATLQSLRSKLQSVRASDNFPVVAARMLLGDIEEGHEIQTRDRAACEAWAVALALAAGLPKPPYDINPLTGKPYQVVESEEQIAVWGIGTGTAGDDRPAIVPLSESP